MHQNSVPRDWDFNHVKLKSQTWNSGIFVTWCTEFPWSKLRQNYALFQQEGASVGHYLFPPGIWGKSTHDWEMKLSTLKLGSPAEFMINSSIQDFIPFLVTSDLNPMLTEHYSTGVRWLKSLLSITSLKEKFMWFLQGKNTQTHGPP